MRKQKGSLEFPSNPLERLQQLRNEVLHQGKISSDGVQELKDTLMYLRSEKPEELEAELANVEPVRDHLRPKVTTPFSEAQKEPTSRLNVEIAHLLHTRLKTHCATHNVHIRQVIAELIEEFLKGIEQKE